MNRSDFPHAWYADVLEHAKADSGIVLSATLADSEVVARMVVYNDRVHGLCFFLRLDPAAREFVEGRTQHRFLTHWQDSLDENGRTWHVVRAQINEDFVHAAEHLFRNFMDFRDYIRQAHAGKS